MITEKQLQALDKWANTIVDWHVPRARQGTWDGRRITRYFRTCRHVSGLRGISTIFTRDVGYHTSGWWKNPDYERCYHLSVSHFDPATEEPKRHDEFINKVLVQAFFRKYAKWVWIEPPYADDGKELDVYHFRLFCDENWQPIKPRGEVYSKELTEAGWKSFSDVQEAVEATGVNPNLETVR